MTDTTKSSTRRAARGARPGANAKLVAGNGARKVGPTARKPDGAQGTGGTVVAGTEARAIGKTNENGGRTGRG